MDPQPIMPSATDLARRRLETTIDHDLHSLSLGSLITTSASSTSQSEMPRYSQAHSPSSSMSSMSSIEFGRGFGEGDTGRGTSLVHPYPPYPEIHGPHGTPRAAARKASGMSLRSEFDSPVSTAGHHVSAMTLNQGIFRRGRDEDSMDGDEFDPERSLGRLVGELGKVMGNRISPRPTSPFAALSPPRSPSPFSIQQNAQNLSLTLNRNDPLPSPPHSRAGSRSASGSSAESVKLNSKAGLASSRFSSIARELGNDIRVRQPLGDSQRHNTQQSAPPASARQQREESYVVPTKDRMKSLQSERRTTSAPARVEGDLTGMTGLMATPAKGGDFDDVAKNGAGNTAGAGIPQALATLHARLRALETENSLSRRRVRELESELERAKGEVETAIRSGGSQLRDVIGEKTALEDLIKSLRNHLTRLTSELEQNKALVVELRQVQSQPAHLSPPRGDSSVTQELVSLRKEVERLGTEVHRLGGIVEEGLDTRRRARGEKTVRMEQEEAEKLAQEIEEEDEITTIQREMEKRSAGKSHAPQQGPPPTPGPSRLAQGLRTAAGGQKTVDPVTTTKHAARSSAAQQPASPVSDASDGRSASPTPTTASVKSRSRRSQRDTTQRAEGPASPFPSIRVEDEGEFFASAEKNHRQTSSNTRKPSPLRFSPAAPSQTAQTPFPVDSNKTSAATRQWKGLEGQNTDLPPQTVLARVIRELEADFAHYKAIYAELADQYKILDAASAVAKRKVLAAHLKEVIDTLEQKADQIAALYDLLTFKDRPDAAREGEGKVHKSVPDILRMVKESLGEEGLRRLEEDGVGVGMRARR